MAGSAKVDSTTATGYASTATTLVSFKLSDGKVAWHRRLLRGDFHGHCSGCSGGVGNDLLCWKVAVLGRSCLNFLRLPRSPFLFLLK